MHERIRPLDGSFVCAGRAKTILAVDVYQLSGDPYKMEIESVDSVRPDEVIVACTNNSIRTGFWGELLSTAAQTRGARGVIVDGLVRDVKKIVALGFPVFAAGIKPVDSKGRSIVLNYDCPTARCLQPGSRAARRRAPGSCGQGNTMDQIHGPDNQRGSGWPAAGRWNCHSFVIAERSPMRIWPVSLRR